MKKLIRNAGAIGASAAMVTGALLATAGSAAAAPEPTAHTAAPATTATGLAHSRHNGIRLPSDPWIAGQLAQFYPQAQHHLAVFDPWVKDQLARFNPSAG
ncbi:hypothetical protein ACWEN3_37605 [Streptomyces sp. NPDC004561]